MFEKICVHYSDNVGKICEALLYYDEVEILFNERTLNRLFNNIAPNEFVPFLYEHKDRIHFHYYETGIGSNLLHMNKLQTEGDISDCSSSFSFNLMLESDVDRNPYIEYLRKYRRLPNQGDTSKDKKIADKFIEMLVYNYHSHNFFEDIVNDINSSKTYQEFCRRIVSDSINYKLDENVRFVLEEAPYSGKKIRSLNHAFSDNTFNDIKSFTIDYVTNFMKVYEASEFNADIYNLKANERLITSRITESLKLVRDFDEQNEIIRLTTNQVNDIASVINNGSKGIREFNKLYEKSHKYKEWLKELDGDSKLINEYCRAITTDSAFDKSPMKIMRYFAFTALGFGADLLGAGGLGTMTSLGISGIDAFVLDKLFGGWKPNQFINKDVKKFLK
jgi:hypothetical protein